jgi:hypothetical protein
MIVQAAIRLNGKIYTGKRHSDVFKSAAEHGLGFGGLKFGEQGFVTDTGEFLNREESRKHFVDAKQVPAHGALISATWLDSSDLY